MHGEHRQGGVSGPRPVDPLTWPLTTAIAGGDHRFISLLPDFLNPRLGVGAR